MFTLYAIEKIEIYSNMQKKKKQLNGLEMGIFKGIDSIITMMWKASLEIMKFFIILTIMCEMCG